jgi:hypothetical protein
MKEQLERIVHEIPYNTFRPTMEKSGKTCPMQLGGDCIYQNRLLGQALRRDGYKTGFLRTVSYDKILHVATVGMDGDELFYLDPFIMHTDPIPLTHVLKRGKPYLVKAFPKSGKHGNKIMVKPTGKKSFDVSLFWVTPRSYVPVRAYPFSLDGMKDTLPSSSESAKEKPPKRRITLRIPVENGDVVHLNLNYGTGLMDIAAYDAFGGSATIQQKDDPGLFDSQFMKISEAIHLQPHRIREAFYSSLNLCLQNLE